MEDKIKDETLSSRLTEGEVVNGSANLVDKSSPRNKWKVIPPSANNCMPSSGLFCNKRTLPNTKVGPNTSASCNGREPSQTERHPSC